MSDTDTDTNEPQTDIAGPAADPALDEPPSDDVTDDDDRRAGDDAADAEAEAEAARVADDADRGRGRARRGRSPRPRSRPRPAVDDAAPTGDVATEAEAEAPMERREPSVDRGGDVITDEELLERPPAESPYDRPGRWFVVHTQSGYEKKVKQNLEARIVSMNAEDAIYEVVIPMEDYVDFRNGKRIVAQRKMFPGYLLVRAALDDQAWFVIRNTPGVTGFVGQGAKPSPLPRRDVESFLMPKGGTEEQVAQRARPRLEYEIGETVRVREGPFADFSGEVIELNEDQLKLKVLVNIFGRETPVELEFSKVAKL